MRHYAASVGIPSGRSFAVGLRDIHPPDRHGRQDRDGVVHPHRHRRPGRASSATSPSIPAVRRPVLRCVTCRTLTSVLARLRSISFCRFLTFGQSRSCAAVKIRCRSRRTCSSARASRWRPTPARLRSVHRSGVQLALRFRLATCFSSQLTCPRQRAFGPGHQARYPAGYTGPSRRRSRPAARFPAAFRLPAFASWASCPAGDSAPLTIGLPRRPQAARTRAGFPRSARVRHDRVGCSLYPGDDGAHTATARSRSRRLPPSSGRSLSPRHHDPPRDVQLTRHQQEFTGVHPVPAFPSPVTPGRNGDPWAFP